MEGKEHLELTLTKEARIENLEYLPVTRRSYTHVALHRNPDGGVLKQALPQLENDVDTWIRTVITLLTWKSFRMAVAILDRSDSERGIDIRFISANLSMSALMEHSHLSSSSIVSNTWAAAEGT